MKLGMPLTEDQFVQEFLVQELNSQRFSDQIRTIITKKNLPESIITDPDFSQDEENKSRSSILGDYRGYKQKRLIFTGYPDNVKWYEATMTKDELLTVRYVNYSYWNELSNNTRMAIEAVKNIRKGNIPYNQTDELFVKAAEAYKAGKKFAKLIIYANTDTGPYQVLEGHLRLTAMIMEKDLIPEEVEVIVGVSKDFTIA